MKEKSQKLYKNAMETIKKQKSIQKRKRKIKLSLQTNQFKKNLKVKMLITLRKLKRFIQDQIKTKKSRKKNIKEKMNPNKKLSL